MRFFLMVVLLLAACTTFNANENGLRRACRSGVATYDDGSLTFRCKEDTDGNSSDNQDQRRDSGRATR
jgi:hypothetical protein